jgi:hypothetical protein|nr:MAG TPA: hypothetical protein [Caudoviricetes sp.]
MAKSFNLTVRNLVYRLRKFKSILDQELKNEILRHEDVIVEMITQGQLYELGIEGRGREIMSYMPYRPRTIKKKLKKGQPTNRVTLKDTGSFYASLHVEFDDDGFYVTSTQEKAKFLLKKYGKTIFRLTDQNLKTLLDNCIRPSLKEKMKEYIKNG